MRCPSCEKFVSFDEPEIDASGAEVMDGEVTSSVRVVLKCADCGDELKETTFDLSGSIAAKDNTCKGQHMGVAGEPGDGDDEHDWSLKEETYDPTDRYETTGKNGKPIPSRFQRHYYGVQATFELECSNCDETCTVEVSDETQASSFDELV